MEIFGRHIPFTLKKVEKKQEPIQGSTPEPAQSYNYTDGYSGGWRPLNSHIFDGEKTPGELGNPINLIPDYNALRLRSYEAELKGDVVKIITSRFFKWVVGDGLKNQPQPNEKTLLTEGVTNDWKEFRSVIEARFKTYSESDFSDFSNMDNLHVKAKEAFETSFLGGDCLVVMRVDENLNPNVQVIDGQHLQTPWTDSAAIEAVKARGNRIKHGVEIDKRNKHVAFFVRKDVEYSLPEYERIEAVGKNSGCLMAWLIVGKKHRIDHVRGIGALTPILEKVDKLDRYTEASVGSAEERAKVPWFIEHNQHSDGEDPMVDVVRAAAGGGSSNEKTSWDLAEVTRKEVYISQGKTVSNLPIGATMKALESKQELNYDGFFRSIFMQICAALDVPYEVALQKYDSNYSASRAAINGWGYIVDLYRKKHTRDFYKPVYDFWFYCEVLKNKINAPGYLKAKSEKNLMVVNAYTEGMFLGVNLPHIDPLKEVKAVREMIGDKSKGQVPLITLDQATEQLNNGSWMEIYKKHEEEMEITKGAYEPKEPIQVVTEKEDGNKDKNTK